MTHANTYGNRLFSQVIVQSLFDKSAVANPADLENTLADFFQQLVTADRVARFHRDGRDIEGGVYGGCRFVFAGVTVRQLIDDDQDDGQAEEAVHDGGKDVCQILARLLRIGRKSGTSIPGVMAPASASAELPICRAQKMTDA